MQVRHAGGSVSGLDQIATLLRELAPGVGPDLSGDLAVIRSVCCGLGRMRLSCMGLRNYEVRLKLHALAWNLASFMIDRTGSEQLTAA